MYVLCALQKGGERGMHLRAADLIYFGVLNIGGVCGGVFLVFRSLLDIVAALRMESGW